jgi:hypothetical protein
MSGKMPVMEIPREPGVKYQPSAASLEARKDMAMLYRTLRKDGKASVARGLYRFYRNAEVSMLKKLGF